MAELGLLLAMVRSRSLRSVSAAASVAAVLGAPAPASLAAAPRPAIGDLRVLAHVPYPGNPGGMAVDGKTLWVDTSAGGADRPFDGQMSVFAYNVRTGARLPRKPIVVPTQPVATMGLAGIALDRAGRQYVANMNGDVLRIDPRSDKIEIYGTVPTSTWTSATTMPAFDAFGPDGSLYVSDATAPAIWRIPPGGGQAELWFTDPRLGGHPVGGAVVGLAVDARGRDIYFASGNNTWQTTVFRLPIADPSAANLETVHTYDDPAPPSCPPDQADPGNPDTPVIVATCATTAGTGAGAIAFGASGRLYVALLGKNQISILEPDGSERSRFPRQADNSSLDDKALSGPFGLAFDGRGHLLISDLGDSTWAYGPGRTAPPWGLSDSKTWAVMAAWVGDTAGRLFTPQIPDTGKSRRLTSARQLPAQSPVQCILGAVRLEAR